MKDHGLHRVPPSVRALLREFRDRLVTILGVELVGVYLMGGIAFPGFRPSGDVDFFVVTRGILRRRQREELSAIHRTLAETHQFGNLLDGFYISSARARSGLRPTGLGGGRDDSWALHREHLRRGAYIALVGPPAKDVFLAPTPSELERDLAREELYALSKLGDHPHWAVLQLCRIALSRTTGNVVRSKLQAGEWALTHFPREWHPLLRSALKIYRGRGGSGDFARVKRQSAAFSLIATPRSTGRRRS